MKGVTLTQMHEVTFEENPQKNLPKKANSTTGTNHNEKLKKTRVLQEHLPPEIPI